MKLRFALALGLFAAVAVSSSAFALSGFAPGEQRCVRYHLNHGGGTGFEPLNLVDDNGAITVTPISRPEHKTITGVNTDATTLTATVTIGGVDKVFGAVRSAAGGWNDTDPNVGWLLWSTSNSPCP